MTLFLRYLWILFPLSGLVAQSRLEQLPQKPMPCPAEWLGFIGEYSDGEDTLLVLERSQKLVFESMKAGSSPAEVQRDLVRFPNGEFLSSRGGEFLRTNAAVSGLRLGSREFAHILTGGEGVTFRIVVHRDIGELRTQALAAAPPTESREFLSPDLAELVKLDSTIRLEIRYATSNNFMSTPFYSQARAFLQRPAAEALRRAHVRLKQFGYGLLIHDAYRPWYVTKMFWDATPEHQRVFVADPSKGSRHNRGCAVDLTLYSLATGAPVEMPSGYDEFSGRAYPGYGGGTSLQRWHRELLRTAMEEQGFAVYEFEWWHFDYRDWQRYPIMNVTFDKIL